MAKQKIDFKMVGTYQGHSVKKNSAVDLKFAFAYSELENYLNLFKVLNQNIKLGIKLGLNKPANLGLFNLNGFRVDKDGEAAVTFSSETSYVEYENINLMVEERDQVIIVRCTCEIEMEDDEEEDNE